MKHIVQIICVGACIPIVIFIGSIFSAGERQIGKLENIWGIPYPNNGSMIIVQEKLAHADIFLQESVFGKNLHLTVSFNPGAAEAIDVGIREGGFWLGYAKEPLYRKGKDPNGFQTKEFTVPLTSMFQDTDRSIDMMFFADRDVVSWSVHAVRATVNPVFPTFQEIKEYGKSIITRERAL